MPRREPAGARADEAFAAQLERDGLAAFVDAWERQALFASQRELPVEARERLRARAPQP